MNPLDRAYRSLHELDARMIDFPSWRIPGRTWDRLTADRITLRKAITLHARAQTRARADAVEQDELGGPPRPRTPTAQSTRDLDAWITRGLWVAAAAGIVGLVVAYQCLTGTTGSECANLHHRPLAIGGAR